MIDTTVDARGIWTADENCYIGGYIQSQGAKAAVISMNGYEVCRAFADNVRSQSSFCIPCKKGAVISRRTDDTDTINEYHVWKY